MWASWWATISSSPSGGSSMPGSGGARARERPAARRRPARCACRSRAPTCSACFRSPEPRRERRHRELWIRQPAFGRQGVRAGGARLRLCAANPGHRRSGSGRARGARGIARRRRFRGLPPRPRCGERDGGGAGDAGAPPGPAVPGHLCGHAAHGRARPRICGDARARLDRRRGRPHLALRSGPQDPTHGVEHIERGASAQAPRRHPGRTAGPARLFRALVSPQACRARKPGGASGLWRARHRDRGAGHRGRHAVPSGEEPAARAQADRQFSQVEAVILFPAIDLKDGLCVRLEAGDMARATVFHRDPAAQAQAFAAQGFEYLHVVDLDGAFAGKPVNAAAVDRILAATALPVQLGGGIRALSTVEAWLRKGVARVIIGTAAVRDPDLVREAARKFPGRVAVGLDARAGLVAVEGWAKASELSALEVARRFEDAGVAAIVYTDIARDGLLKGLNLDATIALADAVAIPVIASGGLASLADIEALLAPRAARLAGAIAGRALYDGRLNAAAALALIAERRSAVP